MFTVVIIFNIVAVVLLWNAVLTGEKSRRNAIQRIASLDQRRDMDETAGRFIDLRRKTEELPGVFQWMVKPMPMFSRLGNRLEFLQMKVTPQQYVLRLCMLTLIIVLLVSGLLKQSILLGLALGLTLGVLLPLLLLRRAINKRTEKFLKLFPDAIDLLVRGLRAGLPVPESMQLAAQEIAEPVGGVFDTVINTMKLGMTLEAALREEARKLDITEFDFFTVAIGLQRETGGNLTEILSNLAGVLRNRTRMLLKIRAISAEARASGYVLTTLPFLVGIGLSIINPTYLMPLFHDPRGHTAIAVGLCMLAIGTWLMRRVTQFEI